MLFLQALGQDFCRYFLCLRRVSFNEVRCSILVYVLKQMRYICSLYTSHITFVLHWLLHFPPLPCLCGTFIVTRLTRNAGNASRNKRCTSIMTEKWRFHTSFGSWKPHMSSITSLFALNQGHGYAYLFIALSDVIYGNKQHNSCSP